METIRPQNKHEEFGTYVSSSLAQIKDEQLFKTTKCQIQIALARAMAQYAEKQLASSASVQQVVIIDSNGRIIQQQHEHLIENLEIEHVSQDDKMDDNNELNE